MLQVNECCEFLETQSQDDYDDRRNEIESELYKLHFSECSQINSDSTKPPKSFMLKNTLARNKDPRVGVCGGCWSLIFCVVSLWK